VDRISPVTTEPTEPRCLPENVPDAIALTAERDKVARWLRDSGISVTAVGMDFLGTYADLTYLAKDGTEWEITVKRA